MKNIFKVLVLLLSLVSFTACVQDLNTKPIDTNSGTTFNQSQVFTKCYASLITTGQQMDGDPDVEDINEGFSSFFRSSWFMNELPTDEVWWIWEDPGVYDLNIGSWSGTNDMVQCIYARLNINNKYYNHFMKYADQSNAEGVAEVAEVRFLRALMYYYVMDFFLYAPYCIVESTEYPDFYSRHALYKWLVDTEMPEIIGSLPDKRVNKWRVDKAAGYLLLARIYLNAEVYNRDNANWTEQDSKNAWQKAYDNAQLALSTPANYGLYTNDGGKSSYGIKYSAYQKLFMGDNGENGAVDKEGIFALYQDGVYCRSWGGATLLVLGPRKIGMGACGITTSDPWKSIRTSPTLPRKFLVPAGYSDGQAATILNDEYQMPETLKDDRAIFCAYNDTTYGKTANTWLFQGKQRTQQDSYFYDCWAGCKYNNVYSNTLHPSLSIGHDNSFPDCDILLMRAAEAYLTMAEASFRVNGANQDALNKINALRDRAHAKQMEMSELTEEGILDEWSREFWFEGRRRTDLIRFNRFYGPKSDAYSYQWEGRAALPDGGAFKSGTDACRNWFPVPTKDKNANPKFTEQVIKNSSLPGGDGYAL